MEVNVKDLRFIILNKSSLEHDGRNRVQKAGSLEAIVIMEVGGLGKGQTTVTKTCIPVYLRSLNVKGAVFNFFPQRRERNSGEVVSTEKCKA